ncbi:MAG: hypothetical protein M1821_002687 [Bathelium mastoideum]|nr:MAG: hypothetical protein M1821_002687 [Bathelium mastoideum]
MADQDISEAIFDASDTTRKIDFSKSIDESRLKDMNILVTGGSNGLGAVLSTELAKHGAKVTIADLKGDNGEKLAQSLRDRGLQAHFVATDVRSWESQVNAFKTAINRSATKELDVVIPCAGLPGYALPLPEKISLEEDPAPPSSNTFDVTLTAVYYSTLLSLHYFRLPSSKPFRKQLVFIGSLASYLEIPPMADYSATKFGVRGLWKTIRREMREMGMRTNLIAPTFMPTQVIANVSPALERLGAKLAKVENAVSAVVRVITDEEIDGRAVAVGGYGEFDLRDDYEGLDGGVEILRYFESGAMGGGMHTLRDILGGRPIKDLLNGGRRTSNAKGLGQLRGALSKGAWSPLGPRQRASLRDPGVKRPVWVSRISYEAPIEQDLRSILRDAISELGDKTEEITIPSIGEVKAQWTGWRADAAKAEPEPSSTEKEKYNRLCKDAKNDKLTGARCYTVQYRLAPQNPFPAALLDIIHGYLTLLYPPAGSFHSPVSPSDIVFAGDSAGAYFAITLIQVILSFHRNSPSRELSFHNRRVALPLPAGVTVISPALDQLTCLPSWHTNADHDIFNNVLPATQPSFPSCSIWPSTPAREHPYATARTLVHPLASPCTRKPEHWSRCPPLWVGVGGGERLIDAARILARDVKNTGGWVQWAEYEQMPHLWPMAFKNWWQSNDAMKRWADACSSMWSGQVNGTGEIEAKILTVSGEEKAFEWDDTAAPDHESVLDTLKKTAATMKVYTGQTDFRRKPNL